MSKLPIPCLEKYRMGAIPVLTDQALFDCLGVRVAFTGREGGFSKGAYSSLNLGSHVGDSLEDVLANRKTLLGALGCSDACLLVPNQVHGTVLGKVDSNDPDSIKSVEDVLAKGADGVVVEAPNVAALLCYADCTPVVVVAPSGHFAVVHAGWRGAVEGIVGKAIDVLSEHSDPSQMNVYIGPHIRQECFETGEDVAHRFAEAFGSSCVVDPRHVSLAEAVSADARNKGVSSDRIVDACLCTKCNHEAYFSYRASGGTCGRHGAIAVRAQGRG